MKTKIIIISSEMRDTIQALQYEVNSRQDLLGYMINQGIDIHSEQFLTYQKEYQEFFVKYNRAKELMQHDILEPALPGKIFSWNLDFDSCEVTCSYEG